MKYNAIKNYDNYESKHKSSERYMKDNGFKKPMQMFGLDHKNFVDLNDVYKECCVTNTDNYSRDVSGNKKVGNLYSSDRFVSYEGMDGSLHFSERFEPQIYCNSSVNMHNVPEFINKDINNSFASYLLPPIEHQQFDRGRDNNHMIQRFPSSFNGDSNFVSPNENETYYQNVGYYGGRYPIPLRYSEFPDDSVENNAKVRGVCNMYRSYEEKSSDDYKKENIGNVCTYDSNKFKKRNRVRINDRYVVRGQSYYEKNGKLFKIYKCEYPGCLKEYTNQYSLKYHIEKGHAEEKLDINKPFVCKYGGCFKRYKNKSTLVYHLKNVHKLKNGY